MLKAVGIAGSPRREGNSTTLLKALLAGAAEAGAAGQIFHLNDLAFRGCQACEPCTPDDTCRIEDDLTEVLAALRAADIWALAAPIYFDGVSGQMKLFFDRCRHLTNEAGKLRKMLTGRRAAAVIITYEDKQRDDYRDVARRLVNYLGWMGQFDPIEVVDGAKLGPAGAAAGRPELLARARGIGRKLTGQLGGSAPAGA